MKKAQGISVNVIIVTILALLVLVVLAVIFSVRTGKFSQKAGGEEEKALQQLCREQGGICLTKADCASRLGVSEDSLTSKEFSTEGPAGRWIDCASLGGNYGCCLG